MPIIAYIINSSKPDRLITTCDIGSYAFGSPMPGRTATATGGDYRFGFNGKENENDISGEGNNLDFGARIYDSRLGRWLSRDPLEKKYCSQSTYNAFNDNPILFTDPSGQGGELGNLQKKGDYYTATLTFNMYIVVDDSQMPAMNEIMALQGASFTQNEIYTVGNGVITGEMYDPRAGDYYSEDGYKTKKQKIYVDVRVQFQLVSASDAKGMIENETNAANNYLYLIGEEFTGAPGERNWGKNQGFITGRALSSPFLLGYLGHNGWHSAGATYENEKYAAGSHNDNPESIMLGARDCVDLSKYKFLEGDFNALAPAVVQKWNKEHSYWNASSPVYPIVTDHNGSKLPFIYNDKIDHHIWTKDEMIKEYEIGTQPK